MKKEELMANDWVFNTYNQQPEQVCEIREQMVMLAYNDLYDYDEFEPIPLTEEILQKHFPNTDDGLTWWPITETDTFSVHIDIPDSEDHDKYAHIYTGVIRYVHELQHILTLCHITKDIEL